MNHSNNTQSSALSIDLVANTRSRPFVPIGAIAVSPHFLVPASWFPAAASASAEANQQLMEDASAVSFYEDILLVYAEMWRRRSRTPRTSTMLKVASSTSTSTGTRGSTYRLLNVPWNSLRRSANNVLFIRQPSWRHGAVKVSDCRTHRSASYKYNALKQSLERTDRQRASSKKQNMLSSSSEYSCCKPT